MSSQPAKVRQQRNEVLSLRGITEMLVLAAQQAHHRLCNGRYQASLKSDIPGKHELRETAAQELREVVDALNEQLRLFEDAVQHFDSLALVTTASSDCIQFVGRELDDHQARLQKLKGQVGEWQAALKA
jgi:hypothetical protein